MSAPSEHETKPVPKYMYVCNYGTFWRLTGAEWVALCQNAVTQQAGYDLSPYRRLARPPRGFLKNRERELSTQNDYNYSAPPHIALADAYVEPLDWEPEDFRLWLIDHGVTPCDQLKPKEETPWE